MRQTIRASALLGACLLWIAATPVFRQSLPISISGSQLIRAGKPYQLISGAMHYVRIPREYWSDRLRKARAMGLNTVETYVFWNLHEPRPGVFDFSGNLDVAAYVRTAQQAHTRNATTNREELTPLECLTLRFLPKADAMESALWPCRWTLGNCQTRTGSSLVT